MSAHAVRVRVLACVAALLLAAVALTAHAAQSRDSCRAYIDSLPATIASEGTYCMRGHLYTSQTSGNAISVQAENVTIDCNHFRLSGLGAGAGSSARGIATSRSGMTLRNCRVQGFSYGLEAAGGSSGHLVESNRFELSTYMAIHIGGDASVVRDNDVIATGGRTGSTSAWGIFGQGGGLRIIGNTVQGITPLRNAQGNAFPHGIASSGLIEDNHVSGLDAGVNGTAHGITGYSRSVIRGNTVTESNLHGGAGITGSGQDTSICRDNDVILYATEFQGCRMAGTNMTNAGPSN